MDSIEPNVVEAKVELEAPVTKETGGEEELLVDISVLSDVVLDPSAIKVETKANALVVSTFKVEAELLDC